MEEAFTTEIRDLDELLGVSDTVRAETNYFSEEAYVFDESDEYTILDEESDVINSFSKTTEDVTTPSSPVDPKTQR